MTSASFSQPRYLFYALNLYFFLAFSSVSSTCLARGKEKKEGLLFFLSCVSCLSAPMTTDKGKKEEERARTQKCVAKVSNLPIVVLPARAREGGGDFISIRNRR